MAKEINLSIVGIGNMGLPIAKAILEQQVLPASCITLVNSNLQNLKLLKRKNPRLTIGPSAAIIKQPDYLLIAVKPQDFVNLAEGLRAQITKNTIVISVMAGVSVAKIKKLLGASKVVRVMPNLAIEYMGAVIGCYYDPSLTASNKSLIKKIFQKQGLFLELDKEGEINHITAIAGSGPAYVAYFMEAMSQAAKDFGFSEQVAEQLVQQTFAGTVNFLAQKKMKPEDLISKVKSKGGTTEAALNVFNKQKIQKSIQLAICAALKRSEELGS